MCQSCGVTTRDEIIHNAELEMRFLELLSKRQRPNIWLFSLEGSLGDALLGKTRLENSLHQCIWEKQLGGKQQFCCQKFPSDVSWCDPSLPLCLLIVSNGCQKCFLKVVRESSQLISTSDYHTVIMRNLLFSLNLATHYSLSYLLLCICVHNLVNA